MPTTAPAGYSDKQIKAALAVCEALREFLSDDSGPVDRATAMVTQYGECVTQAKAARMLDKNPSSIRKMLDDGRLTRVCGNKVEVRSIAVYMDASRQSDFKARIAKRNGGKVPGFYAI